MGKNNPTYKNTPQSELASAYFYTASLPLTKKNDRSFNTLEPKLSLRFSPHDMKNNSGGSRRIEINNVFTSNRMMYQLATIQKLKRFLEIEKNIFRN